MVYIWWDGTGRQQGMVGSTYAVEIMILDHFIHRKKWVRKGLSFLPTTPLIICDAGEKYTHPLSSLENSNKERS